MRALAWASSARWLTSLASPMCATRSRSRGHRGTRRIEIDELRLRLLRDRHVHAGDLHLEHAQTRACTEVDGLPVVASKGNVGRVGKAVHDAAEFLATRRIQ